MNSQLFSVSKIFTERLFRIPDYQRGYAWTERQLKDFWNDLDQLEDGHNHYTGVLTLEEVPRRVIDTWIEDQWIVHSKGYSPFYVVDGQQRLTTTIILIQVITECIPADERLNYTSPTEIKKKFIFDSKDEGGISRSYIFGYEKDNPSYEYLKTRIFSEPSDNSFRIEETIYTHNLNNAKRFFLERLRSLSIQEIERIYKKLTQNFLFNVYTIQDEIDVFVTFETMNNRGIALSHLELLKNRLIYLSTKFNVEKYEKDKLRHSINESWKVVYHYLGKNKLKPLDDDVFLYNHFLLYFGHTLANELLRRAPRRGIIRQQDVYKDYLLENVFTPKNIVIKTKEHETSLENGKLDILDIYKYVNNLKNSVELWYQLLNPGDSPFTDEENVWLHRLNRLDILYCAPLVMVFFQKEQSPEQRIHLLQALERLLFLDLLSGRVYMARRGDTLIRVARTLSSGRTTTDKVMNDVNAEVETIKNNTDIIEALLRDIKNRSFYGWNGIRYFLYEYEMHLQEQSKTSREKINWEEYRKEEISDHSTVEHIYPQTPRRLCWTEKFKHYSEKERTALRHSLGNLVPLSRAKNSSFHNDCFNDKKVNRRNTVGYAYGSYSEIEVSQYPDWTAKEILQRGLKLLNFMETRWGLVLGDSNDKIKLLNLEFVPVKEGLDLTQLAVPPRARRKSYIMKEEK